MATAPSMGKLIYHITSIDNLPSILKFGLLSRKCILQNHDIHFTDIADPEILSKRERYKEALSQYVLFHFFAKNPFDGAAILVGSVHHFLVIGYLSPKSAFP